MTEEKNRMKTTIAVGKWSDGTFYPYTSNRYSTIADAISDSRGLTAGEYDLVRVIPKKLVVKSEMITTARLDRGTRKDSFEI